MHLIPWILLALALLVQLAVLPVLIKRKDADGPAWQGAVPGSLFPWLDLIGRPKHWALFLLVPGINLLMLTIMHVELGLAFGKRSTKDQWMFGALPWWALWELRQQDQLGWENRDWSKTRKSTAREWSEALLWAVVVAGSLRMLIVEPFTIPTPSMEGSMLVGTTSLSTRRRTGPSCPRPPCPCRSFTTPFLGA